MKIGKYEIIIRKVDKEIMIFRGGDLESIYLMRNFSNRYCNWHFSKRLYNKGRIPVIKQLREAHRTKFGFPCGLRDTKEFLDAKYKYKSPLGD